MKPSDLLPRMQQLVDTHLVVLRKTVRKTLARLTAAFLCLAVSVRFGYGALHLTWVARARPRGGQCKSNYQWLSRFLPGKSFDPASLAEGRLALVLGRRPPRGTRVLIDPTTIDDLPVLNAAIPLQGRAVPVAGVDFQYPWTTTRPLSQNSMEGYWLSWLAEAAPPQTGLRFVFHRGYARVALSKELHASRQPYILPGKGDVMIRATVRGSRQRLRLDRLPHRSGVPIRYRHVLYHGTQPEPVDVIVYRGQGFQDAWFLIVPPDSESWLPTGQLVARYRQRMPIQHCFRDGKSHLGLRGLRLEVQKPERLLRLLMAFTMAYLITLRLGQDPLAQKWRPYFELQRRSPRQGTTKILSVLSMALYWLSDPRRQSQAMPRLSQILIHLSTGRGVRLAPVFSP